MKTTIDIPDDLLTGVMEFTGAKTKRDAVVQALEKYHRRERVEAFIKRIKEHPLDMPSNDEIEAADIIESTRRLEEYQSRAPEA
ncbi:MAG: type II toxin-antitoxin system VapB family antitoxin [Akkermansiaceae bacterium]|nr:type II toxin-antitoxin system VapB family antitoxin [Akkermansiaceae bacterium]